MPAAFPFLISDPLVAELQKTIVEVIHKRCEKRSPRVMPVKTWRGTRS